MAQDQTLEINYLIKAVDQASATLKKIDSSLADVQKTTGATAKATETLGTIHTDVYNGMKNGYNQLGNLASKYGLSIVAITGFISAAANKVLDFASAISDELSKSMEENIKLFIDDEKAGQSFAIVIDAVSKASNGSIKSIDAFNGVVDEMVVRTGKTVGEMQDLVKQFVIFSSSAGLNQNQIETLLPVISKLSIVSGKDLATAMNAVEGALLGQTRSLKELAIVISQGDIENMAKQYGLNSKNLTDVQKKQIIYNLLIEKSSVLNKAAEEATKLLSFQLQKQNSEWADLKSNIGKGGEALTKIKIYGFQQIIDVLTKLGPDFQAFLGSAASMTAILLGSIVTVTKLAVEIGILATSIIALNAALKSQAAIGFIASMKESAVVIQLLNGAFAPITKSIIAIATIFTSSGITISTAIKAITLLMGGLITQVGSLLLTISPFIAIGAAIASVIYILFNALERIEKQTGVFSRAWQSLKAVFGDLSPFESLKTIINNITNGLVNFVDDAITYTAIGIIKLVQGIDYLRIAFVYLVDFIKKIPQEISEFIDKSYEKLKKFGSDITKNFKSLIGFSDIYADSLDDVNRTVSEGTKAKQGLNAEDQKAIELIQGQISYNQDVINGLLKRSKAQEDVAKASKAAGLISAEVAKKDLSAQKELQNALEAIKLSASEKVVFSITTDSVSAAFKEVTNQVVEMQKKLNDAKKEDIPELIKQIKSLQEKAIELRFLAVLGDVVEIGKAFGAGAVGLLKLGAKAIGTAIAGPFGAMIGDMIGQLIDIFGQAPEKFQKMIEDALAGIPQILANIVQNLLITLPEALYQGILKIIDQLPALTDAIITSIVQKLSDPNFVVAMAIGITKAFIKAIPNIASGIVKGIINGLTKGLFGRLEKVGKSLEDVAKVFNGIGKFFAGVFKTIKDNLKYLLIPLIVVFSPLIIAIGILYLTIKNFDKIVQFFSNIIRFAIDFFRNLPQFIIDSLTSIPRLIFEGFVTAFNFITVGLLNFMNALINGFQAVLTFLKSLPALLLQGITSGFTLIINALTNLLNAIPQAAIKFTDQVWKGAVNFGNKILDTVDLFVKRLFKGADDFVSAIVLGAGKFVSEILRGITKTGGGLIDTSNGGLNINIPGFGKVGADSNSINLGPISIPTPWEFGGIPGLRAAQGMIVPGNSNHGDRIPARVNSREMILTLDQQARLFNMLQNNIANRDQPQMVELHTTVQLDNRQLGKSIERLTLNGWKR